jgi:hypothetical protein
LDWVERGEPPVGAANQWYHPVEPDAEAVMLLPQEALIGFVDGVARGTTVKGTGTLELEQKGVV